MAYYQNLSKVTTAQMIKKQSTNRHLSPSGLTSRIDPSVVYLSPEILPKFLSSLYIPPWFVNMLKFAVFKLLENVFMSQKIKKDIFMHAP